MRKLAAFIIGILILLFCVGCNKETTPENKTTSAETEDSVTKDVAVYNDILDIYQKLVTFYLSDTFEENWNNGNIPQWYDVLESTISDDKEEYSYHLSNMVVTMKGSLNTLTQSSFGYILLDINNDAFPELFWVREDYSILAVFTVANGEVTLLDAFWNRYVCVVTPDNRLYTRGSSGANATAYLIRKLSSEGKLIPEFIWGTEHIDVSPEWHYYEIVDGEKTVINQTRHDGLFWEHPFELSEAWISAPIIYLESTDETYVTVGKSKISVKEINEGIYNTFHECLYYSGHDGNIYFPEYNTDWILGKTLEYDLFFAPKSDPHGYNLIYLVLKNLDNFDASDDELYFYEYAIIIKETGMESDFWYSGRTPVQDGYRFLTEKMIPLGTYSMCIQEITKPIHEKMSDEWKQNAESAIRLYMDEHEKYQHEAFIPGNYTVYIQGFSKNDVDSIIIFEHENGTVYTGLYYFVHNISGNNPADLNHMALEGIFSDSDREKWLDKVKENAALSVNIAFPITMETSPA